MSARGRYIVGSRVLAKLHIKLLSSANTSSRKGAAINHPYLSEKVERIAEKDAQGKSEEPYELSTGYRIRQMRLERGETQAQFASHLNVSPTMVSLWETNKVKPPQKVLEWQLVPSNASEATDIAG